MGESAAPKTPKDSRKRNRAAVEGPGAQAGETKAFSGKAKGLQERDPEDDALLAGKLKDLPGRCTPEERMGFIGPGLYISPGRYKQVMDTILGRARRQVAAEVVTEPHQPTGYAEGMSQENPQQDQMEGNSRQRGARTTYETHVIRRRGELKKMSQSIEWADDEGRWNFGLAASTWLIEDIGARVWLTALYIRKREGRRHQLEGESEANSEEKRTGVSLEYRYLALTGTYVRHR